MSAFEVRRARPDEREAILEVMRPANMHHVPSPEMGELDLDRFYVAVQEGEIVGAAGWAIRDDGSGKTTLLSVLPSHRGLGIGAALQDARLEAMRAEGARRVTTNADRPATIAWYRDRYGYRVVGELAKEHEFGDPEVDRWTTLELDLHAWASRPGRAG